MVRYCMILILYVTIFIGVISNGDDFRNQSSTITIETTEKQPSASDQHYGYEYNYDNDSMDHRPNMDSNGTTLIGVTGKAQTPSSSSSSEIKLIAIQATPEDFYISDEESSLEDDEDNTRLGSKEDDDDSTYSHLWIIFLILLSTFAIILLLFLFLRRGSAWDYDPVNEPTKSYQLSEKRNDREALITRNLLFKFGTGMPYPREPPDSLETKSPLYEIMHGQKKIGMIDQKSRCISETAKIETLSKKINKWAKDNDKSQAKHERPQC